METSNTKPILLLTLFVSTLTANQTTFASNNTIVTRWNDAALDAIRTVRLGPPATARALAITHTCIYDAWTAYDKKAQGTQLGMRLKQPRKFRTESNKKQAISYAAHECLSDLFPTQKGKFDDLMNSLGYNPHDGSSNSATPAGVGNLSAKAVISYRHNDGSNQLNNYADTSNYVPVNTPTSLNDPNHWQPLTINGVEQKFIMPHWGNVKPFALRRGSQFRHILPKPADANTEADRYEQQAQEIIDYTAKLTERQKVIAEYWADGPSSELPPGHWTLFADYVSQRDHHNTDQDAKMFFALTNALFDASIACWDAKRHFDYIRPVSAIHYLFAGRIIPSWKGPVDGAEWQPYQATDFITPPFSEYVSGHSTFSAAAAEVLTNFTKSDWFNYRVVIPAQSSKFEANIPSHPITLKWATFSDAANEAGISRRYGGIHFVDGDMNGRELGRLVGKHVWRKVNKYWH